MASGLLSKWLYLDETPPIKDSDPKWVGCWFLGFIIASGLVLIISILLLSFPDAIRAEAKAKHAEKKKNRKKIKLETIQENDEIPSINFDLISSSISTTSTSITPSLSPTPTLKKKPSCGKRLINKINHSKIKFKGFLSSFLKLILNFRYALLVIIMSIECILVALFTNYMILYAQNVYQVSSSLSSILVGGVVVPSAILGAVVGGLLVKKFNLYIEGCVRLVILSSCVTIAGIFVLLFIRCETSPSLGIDIAKQIFNTSFSECNFNCNCYASYNPICGSNNVTYVSPCYAGCKIINETGYFDCGCIAKNEKNLITLDAKPGSCSMQCQTKLIVFLIVAFVVVFSETLSITPATMLVLKIIDKPLQPFALGLLRCANILLAYIPAPIVLSQVIDKTCVLWNNECQGDKGTCLEYNSFDFHFVLFGSAAGIKIVSGIFLIVFSIYIHKSYILRRKYRSKAVLNHDPGSILTPRQKYKIDCEVASSETSSLNSQDVSSIRNLYRRKKETLPRKESGITLKKHIILEDAYSLASQNQNDESNEKLSDFYDLTSSNFTTPVRQLNSDSDNGLITSNF
ncbi:unnamed protein product [Brachionus calyciflorus]|uniref:Kazal-like domain-containing protein n=1 Tax=Brachionus calyciflorus TaxID=104777 RepID=A0A813XY16_9BILA|nr:unnamed protein product [Brachionus calyciflorus]